MKTNRRIKRAINTKPVKKIMTHFARAGMHLHAVNKHSVEVEYFQRRLGSPKSELHEKYLKAEISLRKTLIKGHTAIVEGLTKKPHLARLNLAGFLKNIESKAATLAGA